jgi:ribosome-associated translation inhibitor RaiA
MDMAEPVIAISFKDLEPDEEVREQVAARLRTLSEEFPEPTRIEVTLAPDGALFSAHAHVTGRATDLAAAAKGAKLGLAADRLLDKLTQALRRAHEKRLFAARRGAKKDNPKRRPRE